MTRDELLSILARMVDEGKLSTDEAAAILEDFDDGEIDPEELPLTEEEARTDAVEAAAAALLLLLLLLGGDSGEEAARRFAALTPAARAEVMERLSDHLDSRADDVAEALTRTGSVREWHDAALVHAEDDIFAKAALGKGAPLTEAEIAALREAADEQAARVKRLADEVAARKLAGRPMSEKLIAARMKYAASAGRAAFFRYAETSGGEGYVVDYRARDDSGTCSPCLGAERGGPYLPSTGPMPGDVCLGGGHCRCSRELRYAPEEAARLRGEPVTT